MKRKAEKVKIVECPRDAMQGLRGWIPTEAKISYLQSLLAVGFDTLDFGSFVSPKAVPQMRDTFEVYQGLDLSETDTKLLAIVVNERGVNDAVRLENISYLGYPFSVSETFQMRNTNASIEESMGRVAYMQEQCVKHDKVLVVYLSMGFGNPYGDPWNAGIVLDWVERLVAMDIGILSLSDTIGVSTPESIRYLFGELIEEYPDIEFGAHLHTTPDKWREKLLAGLESGCRRFDGAIKGYGGCPMAKDDLTGNMPTERMVSYFDKIDVHCGVDLEAMRKAVLLSSEIFPPSV